MNLRVKEAEHTKGWRRRPLLLSLLFFLVSHFFFGLIFFRHRHHPWVISLLSSSSDVQAIVSSHSNLSQHFFFFPFYPHQSTCSLIWLNRLFYFYSGRLCGSNKIPDVIMSSGYRMLVTYKSSSVQQKAAHRGFKANFEGDYSLLSFVIFFQ